MRAGASFVAILLLAALLPGLGLPIVAPASACLESRVPCGSIYPRVQVVADDWPTVPPSVGRVGMTVEALLRYEFDPMAEGLALDQPGQPIVVTFEFPKKPAWATLAVSPDRITIPIQPQYFRPDPSDPANPQMTYLYEEPITITIGISGQPELPPGVDVARLLVFAKSTESGLYKAGYGIKEFKIAPEGVVHRERAPLPVTPRDVAPIPVGDLEVELAPDLVATIDLPNEIELWRPTPIEIRADPDPAAVLLAAVVDPHEVVHAVHGPALAPLRFNFTFPNTGDWRIVTFAGSPHTAAGAATLHLPHPKEGEAYRLPRDYRSIVRSSLDRVVGNAGDPAAQDERVFRVPVYEGASGADVIIALETPGLSVDRGVGNLNVAFVDPNGAVLQTGTVDPLNPAKRFPVGALPGPGLYRVRVYGTFPPSEGILPAAANFALGVQVVYDTKPLLAPSLPGMWPWKDDGLRLGIHNASLEVEGGEPWVVSRAKVAVEGATGNGVVAGFFLLDSAGRAVAASGAQSLPANAIEADITVPSPGSYTVLAFSASPPNERVQWSRDFVAARIVAGDPTAREIAYPAAYEASASSTVVAGGPNRAGLFTVPFHPAAHPLEVALTSNLPMSVAVVVYDERRSEISRKEASLDGGSEARVAVEVPEGVVATVALLATVPAGSAPSVPAVVGSLGASLRVAYPAAFSVANPLVPGPVSEAPTGLFTPGPEILAVVGLAALAALPRRR